MPHRSAKPSRIQYRKHGLELRDIGALDTIRTRRDIHNTKNAALRLNLERQKERPSLAARKSKRFPGVSRAVP